MCDFSPSIFIVFGYHSGSGKGRYEREIERQGNMREDNDKTPELMGSVTPTKFGLFERDN